MGIIEICLQMKCFNLGRGVCCTVRAKAAGLHLVEAGNASGSTHVYLVYLCLWEFPEDPHST